MPDFDFLHDPKSASPHWPVVAKGTSRMSVATTGVPSGGARFAPFPLTVKRIVPGAEAGHQTPVVPRPRPSEPPFSGLDPETIG